MTEFKTIDELMAGRAPGSVVWLVSESGYEFSPIEKSGNEWYGEDETGSGEYYKADHIMWRLRVPEVERPQLWWFKDYEGEWMLHRMAMTFQEADAQINMGITTSKRPSGIYLPDSE